MKIRVWDLPTRFFHWALLALVAFAWITSEIDGTLFNLHVFAGVAILGLIVFRLVWGVIGSRYARFSDFIKPWPVVAEYGRKMFTRKAPRHLGHNPLGGWMIVFLIVTLTVTVFTGLFTSDDGNAGPLAWRIPSGLAHTMEELHEGVSGFLGFLIGIHVLGVIVHGFVSGENLPRAMWTGYKTVPEEERDSSGVQAGVWWRAIIAVSLSILAVWSLYL